jgi:hypothetical protein
MSGGTVGPSGPQDNISQEKPGNEGHVNESKESNDANDNDRGNEGANTSNGPKTVIPKAITNFLAKAGLDRPTLTSMFK